MLFSVCFLMASELCKTPVSGGGKQHRKQALGRFCWALQQAGVSRCAEGLPPRKPVADSGETSRG